jgi:glycosyltransferase involved in cell wall biosynthesis
MLEAMATGLPVIATTHGGIPEAVEHGASGLLAAERDHAALAQALLTLARDPIRYAQMSTAAAARVSVAFDLHTQARALENYYREAIGNGGNE